MRTESIRPDEKGGCNFRKGLSLSSRCWDTTLGSCLPRRFRRGEGRGKNRDQRRYFSYHAKILFQPSMAEIGR
jgi:hypothetical protein